jgi:DsbC/DsbD-like thiol-disulfide interchange protein
MTREPDRRASFATNRPVAVGALLVWLALALLPHPGAQAQEGQARDPQTDGSPDSSPWVAGPKSRARLIAGGREPDGALLAGVEIALFGKALTYWRNPGDAGVAPSFEAGASRNLAGLEVIYPAPERHDEGGAEAFGWRRGVVFPLRLRPARPDQPILLDLDLRYAACEDICVPAQARLRLHVAPGAGAGQRARIEAWRARAPAPGPPGGLTLAPVPLDGRKGLAAWRVAPGEMRDARADLFAEGPEGYWFETRRAGAGFDLVMTERPAGASGGFSLRLTYADGDKAQEWEIRLDAPPSAP